MDFTAFLNEICRAPGYAEQLVYRHEVPPREARFAESKQPLAGPVQDWLARQGIARLYTHQAQAIDAVRAGANPLIVTGTASGKSLCYQAPLLEMLLADPSARALLLFPTKALCQDQYRNFNAAMMAVGITGVLCGVYDGDTPATTRRKLRDQGGVIFTNPEMLHAGLLPHHARWASFLAGLRLLVLDELHVYNGIFGSNMGNVLRRFYRVCAHYGSAPQFIACSATIANPRELAETLAERLMALIDDDGSPRGKRTYVFWNPPRVRATRSRSRRSANVEAHELMALLIARGVPTITFSKARMTAEMIHRFVCETLLRTAPGMANKVTPYRGGYLPEERRAIEKRLFDGELIGVSTTRALELGIDIGGLDASILVGYPGTLASFFQQTGRAGRRADDALAVLVGLDTPVNQYIMHHPEYIFGRPIEQAVADPDNPYVITGHLRCAVNELALADVDVPRFGPYAELALEVLQEQRKVRHLGDRWYHAANEIPHHEVYLRSYADSNVVIEDVETGLILGEVPRLDAEPIVHPEAIYMHQGDTYRVLALDLQKNIARVKREETDYYTQPLGGTDVHHIDHTLREKPFGTGRAFWGEVTTHFNTFAFEKIRFYELDAVSRHGLELPHFVLETMALWLVPPEPLMAEVRRAGLDAHNGLRGIGYATRMILPLFITCETLDFSHSVGSVNSPWNAIFLYERYPHGLGFTEKAYERLGEIMPAVLEMLETCPCRDGCPCCVGKPVRGATTWNVERGESAIPSKQSALMILRGYLGDAGNLHTADTHALTDSDAAGTIRLAANLRRRLERLREPQVFHPIEPHVPTAYPEIEAAEHLPTPDPARRAERRRDFDRDLQKRIAKKLDTGQLDPIARFTAPPVAPPAQQTTEQPAPEPPPVKRDMAARIRKISSEPKPAAPPPAPPAAEKAPIHLGDPMAARVRRMKRK